MSGARPVITCARCDRHRRVIARGLCSTCYETVRQQGSLDQYERPSAAYDQTSLYCLCPTPVLARIALFDAVYCATCNRAVRGIT